MTIEQWHHQLPDLYRDRAIANTPQPRRRLAAAGPIEALRRGFYAGISPEGWEFWQAVERYILTKGAEPLPALTRSKARPDPDPTGKTGIRDNEATGCREWYRDGILTGCMAHTHLRSAGYWERFGTYTRPSWEAK